MYLYTTHLKKAKNISRRLKIYQGIFRTRTVLKFNKFNDTPNSLSIAFFKKKRVKPRQGQRRKNMVKIVL